MLKFLSQVETQPVMPDSEILTGIMIGGGILLGILIIALIIAKMLQIAAPNEVLIRSGAFGGGDKHGSGGKIVLSGRVLALPVVHRVDRMSLTLMEVPISVPNGYSKGGIAMNVSAVANVKINSDPAIIRNAIERFLGRDLGEIRRVAKETLEGHLRGVIANLTPEQVNEDRLRFAESLGKGSEEDLRKLGLHLDTFKITHVSDEVGYLDAVGRKAIANIIRAAEIAESDAKRNAEQVEADREGHANVIRANVEAQVAQMRNDLRRIKADLDAQIRSEEERTAAAAREARAIAEQKLQQVRAKLEVLRLRVDEVLPAEADREAQQLHARGQAAYIRERGRAVAEALDTLVAAWRTAGDKALQIAIIEDLEKILEAAIQGVNRIDVKAVNVIDSGDGKTLSSYLNAYPDMLQTVFQAVDNTVGIDIPKALAGTEEENQ